MPKPGDNLEKLHRREDQQTPSKMWESATQSGQGRRDGAEEQVWRGSLTGAQTRQEHGGEAAMRD